ncbi:hypothetical protein GIB67_016200 [Kingdonia uniflora]|uniref:Uncharacterized protein n=1 Tax=Kingdonia uniflora TaxID=39325 RepID=A0A7J7LSV4_9MAGN|nr:hypothetical protein GIB67_016200 [Kingdonia uniflora]
MDLTKAEEVDHDLAPTIRICKNGGVERILDIKHVPALLDVVTGVSSKDVIIDPQTGLSTRLYLPKFIDLNEKLPLLIYLHSNGFVTESTFFFPLPQLSQLTGLSRKHCFFIWKL